MFDEIWHITNSGARQVAENLAAIMRGAPRADSDDDEWQAYPVRRPVQIVRTENGTVAIVDVRGALVDNAPPIYRKFGFSDYRDIIADLESVGTNPEVDAVVLRIDSPGGMARGVVEVADAVERLAVPSVAYCDGLACSAAYWIASGAFRIVARPSAVVGNVGTILTWYDITGMLEHLGIEPKALVNSGADLKSTFHLEPDETQIEFLQEQIDGLGAAFRAAVSANRTLDPEVFRAGWDSGDRVLELGLADFLGDLDDAVSAAIGQPQKSNTPPS